jgi:hypothetical protein
MHSKRPETRPDVGNAINLEAIMEQKDLRQRIMERAYEILEQEGRSGQPEDHWLRAEQELSGNAAPEDSGDPLSDAADRQGDFA